MQASQSINVCFSTGTGIISRAIRWFTRATVSHALITFRDELLDKVFVMEVNGRGFMLTPWSKWRQHHELICRFELTARPAAQIAALRAVAGQLGAQYDYIGIITLALRRFWKRMRNPLASSDKLFCSEAVALFLHEADLTGFDAPETFTPGDLLDTLSADARFRRVEG